MPEGQLWHFDIPCNVFEPYNDAYWFTKLLGMHDTLFRLYVYIQRYE